MVLIVDKNRISYFQLSEEDLEQNLEEDDAKLVEPIDQPVTLLGRETDMEGRTFIGWDNSVDDTIVLVSETKNHVLAFSELDTF